MDSAQSAATALQAVNAAVNAQQSYEQQLNQAVYYQQQQVQAQQQAHAHAQAQSQILGQPNTGYTHVLNQDPSLGAVGGITNLPPPINGFQPVAPQTDFSSREELMTYIHKYAKVNGFGIVISHSNDKAIYFTCELGGTYRNKRNIADEKRKRKLNTRKCNCPFAMVANSKKDDNSPLPNRWNLRVTNNEHNHDKLNLTENYPSLRRRNPEVNAMIRELYLQGEKPSIIENKLKLKFRDILINREDIYNETRKMKREERARREGSLPSIQNLTDGISSSQTTTASQHPSSSQNQSIADPIIHHQQNIHQIQHGGYDSEALPSILQAQINQYVGQPISHETHQNQLSQLSELAVESYAQSQAAQQQQQQQQQQQHPQTKVNEKRDEIDENIDTSLGKN